MVGVDARPAWGKAYRIYMKNKLKSNEGLKMGLKSSSRP
jgi:hypothetical protein